MNTKTNRRQGWKSIVKK